MKEVLNQERIPQYWGNMYKYLPQDPHTYSAISICSISVNVLMNIVFNKFFPFDERQSLTIQFGFRSGNGGNDSRRTIEHLQEFPYLSNTKLYPYVAFTAGYGHVYRNFLFSSIRNDLPS